MQRMKTSPRLVLSSTELVAGNSGSILASTNAVEATDAAITQHRTDR